jgi:Ca2+-binding EF-hand superfamily protein
MRKIIIAALAASGATIACAHAETDDRQGRGGEFRAEMREMISGDGMQVDDLANFMQQRSQARFATLDADGNGTVTSEEFLASVDERAKTGFERMDRNDDGVVDRDDRRGWGRHMGGGPRHAMRGERPRLSDEERAERREQFADRAFARLDTDEDGAISRAEFDAGMEARADRRAERGEGRGERHGQRAGRHQGMPREMRAMRGEMRDLIRAGMSQEAFAGLLREGATKRFGALDADGNGELSATEFTAKVAERADRMFARMDRNDDGVVTRDDRPRWGGWRHGGDGKRGQQSDTDE